MENKNFTYIYQERLYKISFNSIIDINTNSINFIINKLKGINKSAEIICQTKKEFKVKISCKINFVILKKMLVEIIKENAKINKINIIFNIDISNNYIANIYTIINVENEDDLIIENMINDFKTKFINNIIKKYTFSELSYDTINNYIYAAMYNIYYHKLIFTINISLYEILIKIMYNDIYFNKNNLSDIDSHDLFLFEIDNESYVFKEYLTICKNCKEYHKTYYNNLDLNKCVYVCIKCNYISKKKSYKEHICNVNKILEYCHLCKYYHNIIKKHIANRGDCYHYNQTIKNFIIENRNSAINKILNEEKKLKEKKDVSKPTNFTYNEICKMGNDNKNNKINKFTQTINNNKSEKNDKINNTIETTIEEIVEETVDETVETNDIEEIDKDNINKDNIDKDNINKDNIDKDNIDKDNIDKDNINKDNIDKDNIDKDNINKDNIDKDNIDKDNIDKENIDNKFDLSDMFKSFIKKFDEKKNISINYKKKMNKNKQIHNFIFNLSDKDDNNIYNFIIKTNDKTINLKI